MPRQTRPFPAIAIVLGGTFKPAHYEVMVETLTSVFTERKVPIQTFDSEAAALDHLKGMPLVGNWRGVMLFISGSRMSTAEQIASMNDDIHVVVLTGMKPPPGRSILAQEKGKVFIIEKNARNNNIANLILPR